MSSPDAYKAHNDPLTKLLCSGAKAFIASAVEAELMLFLDLHQERLTNEQNSGSQWLST